jgi:hypothetical protein
MPSTTMTNSTDQPRVNCHSSWVGFGLVKALLVSNGKVSTLSNNHLAQMGMGLLPTNVGVILVKLFLAQTKSSRMLADITVLLAYKPGPGL